MNVQTDVAMVRVMIAVLLFAGPWGAHADEQVPGEAGTTTVERVSISIRTDEGVVHQASVTLPPEGDEPVMLIPTEGGEAHVIPARSVLALLTELDAATDTFAVSDLVYYDAYGSFFLNCIDVPEHLCGSWQYTVNGAYPSMGMDVYTLSNGDTVYLFFGSPRMVSLPDGALYTNEPFIATVYQYDPEAGQYVPTDGYTLGVVQTDPENPWSPREVATAPAGVDGTALFSVATSGEYAIGIQEDFYYPTVSFSVSVREADVSDGGGGSILTSGSSFDGVGALAFLVSHQEADGSFGPALYTDWAAIALGASGREAAARERLREYLRTDKPDLHSATDYERRAMAMMALGLNPYTDAQENLIAGILGYFDGIQIGDASLVNDDIFTLVPLMRAGYDTESDVIRHIASYLIAEQKDNGSWEGSVDLTAAAIQALEPLRTLPGVSDALRQAVAYLHAAQSHDGGFGNSFATSWALQAIAALEETPDAWRREGLTPLSALIAAQSEDGGMEPADTAFTTRLWATAYAIPAALGKPWHEILVEFKQAKNTMRASNQTWELQNNDTTATTTTSIPVATGTPSGTSTVPAATSSVLHAVQPAYAPPIVTQRVPKDSAATSAPVQPVEASMLAAQAIAADVPSLPWVMRFLAALFATILIGFALIGVHNAVRRR